MVGTSGSAGERVALVTASARRRPAFTCGSEPGRLSNISCTWLASRSAIAGPLPLYGTCTISTPAIDLNSSPDRWLVVPLPAEPMFSLPGLALA
ncbi:hypothetical protein D3C72_1627170 [compost metagenome]